ncbi:uncharacterized protein LOC123407328 isoform X5 [Hordeum vulgare subsp. vulgare]|uniref:uncharacterized protein LOC123407328 isoform X5 n=1 Tax=Hordeum vulgare subsp. vulgare TaxID=112509 RepID=UPI001D1A4258|nr:uncharacterized protein LOC123407328 isoform X5 [Hordeum vulgare subsp. vulgare]
MAKKGAGGEECVVVVPAQTEEPKQGPPRKRNPCPGIRCVGGRIYDPENGKTCHQCRQKTMDFSVACTQPRKKGLCPIHFCHKCLLNRYGEKADDMTKEASWTCPKCRGICNCSFCRKKKGETPTGILAHAAKASGHSSVHDLLIKGSDMVAAAQTLSSLPKKIKKERKKGNIKLAEGDANIGTDLNAIPSVPINKKLKKEKGNIMVNNTTADEKCPVENNGELHIRDESIDVPKAKIELPIGTPVTDIAGAELEADDVGSAIQFYEFCRTFAEVLKIRKGQPEKILQVLTGGGRIGREVPPVVADLHISLLSVIQEDREENPLDYSRNGDAWIIDTGKYISESTVISKELPLDCLSQGVLGYKKLSPSLKLHLLNFLCDEALSTTTLKNWIVKQHESATERKIAAREKFRAVKEKEKELKEKLTIKMAKPRFLRNGAEINSLVSQIKEAYEDKKAVVDEEKLGGLVRKKPARIDEGVAYWKLDGYSDKTAIMRQEFDTIENTDKWFMFTVEEEKVIKDHVAPRSQFKRKKHTLAGHNAPPISSSMKTQTPVSAV